VRDAAAPHPSYANGSWGASAAPAPTCPSTPRLARSGVSFASMGRVRLALWWVRLLVPLTLSLLAVLRPSEAQPLARLPRVGVLVPTAAAVAVPALQVFQQELRALGYHEGQTIALDYRFAEMFDQLPVLAAELARLPVDVLMAGSPRAIRAATQATRTIPIVGVGVPTGWGTSLTGPGPNVTGVTTGGEEFRKAWPELLKAAGPRVSRVAVLWDATMGPYRGRWVEVAARLVGISLQPLEVRSPDEFERAFAAATWGRAEALIVLGSGMFAVHRTRIAELAASSRLPTIALFREFAEAGCLLTYGPNLTEMFHIPSDLVVTF
jgi:putative tryptophan/tyrosine transport system substrate-binding protein